ncbi:MAG: TIGR03915 family putative DNA repair protein [Clostridium sp.]|nr:TIGR03915 family putative DNA repair protein [Clostridium sp.]MDU7084568.1 TIGR03915 family putative DNA repair protein [Clostridium sp.]
MKEFIYDGSFEGLLTCIFYGYPLKEDVKITSQDNYIPSLITEPKEIKTEQDKFERVYESIENKLSPSTLRNVYYLYLSEIQGVETLIFNYIKLCYKYGDKINMAKNNDIIILVDRYCKRVSYESHRFTGFVRFKEIGPLTFYAPIEPDHNILPLLTDHFISRFSDQNFIIHDLKRNLAIIYNKTEVTISPLENKKGEELMRSSHMDNFEDLWKEFYKSVNIEERKNPTCQKRMMPTRYWKHLTEMN